MYLVAKWVAKKVTLLRIPHTYSSKKKLDIRTLPLSFTNRRHQSCSGRLSPLTQPASNVLNERLTYYYIIYIYITDCLSDKNSNIIGVPNCIPIETSSSFTAGMNYEGSTKSCFTSLDRHPGGCVQIALAFVVWDWED